MFEEFYSRCELCPRRCGADRASGERGVCGATDSLRIARAALHFWEEPPISGEAGSGTVFFSNCPLHCVYCQNAPIANGEVGGDVSVSRLSRIFMELQEQGALNINAVTATHYAPQVLAAFEDARKRGLDIPLVWNTSGYETVQTVELVGGIASTFLTDFRYMDAATARRYSHAPDYPEVARDALAAMDRTGADIVVRILALPDHLDEAKDAVRYIHETYGGRVALSLMGQYTPVGAHPRHPELDRRLSRGEYEELLDFADSIGCEDYFWQEGGADEESFIPDFFSLEGVAGPSW